MIVELELEPIRGKKKIIDVKTGKVIEVDETIYVPNLQNIKHKLLKYNPYKNVAEVEIDPSDYMKLAKRIKRIIKQ